MKLISFKSKIIITLFILVIVVSFVTFFTYNYYLSNKIQKNFEKNMTSMVGLLKDQYYFTIDLHNGEIIRTMMKNMESNNIIQQAILIDTQGKVLYPDTIKTVIDTKRLKGFEKNIKIEELTRNNVDFSRAYIRLDNNKLCKKCHSTNEEFLGYIVYDFSISENDNNYYYINLFSLIFSTILIGVIIVIVALMHYKFVKKYLSDFLLTINSINKGDLKKRVDIPETKELSNLAKSFNEMVETFQKTQEELELIHKRKLKDTKKLANIGEMSARLAHEIRNPIMGIANAAEVIIDDISCNQDKSILEEIKRQADRVNNVVADLLKYSRSASLKLKEHDINSLIESLIFFLSNQQIDENIEIIPVLEKDIPEFEFDHDQIEGVLLDIIYNAIHAVYSSGTITIHTMFVDNTHVEILIKDTGVGIPADKLQEIFNPFYTTRTEGTGLGLAIAKDIIEKHGGSITVESEQGIGTVFNICLPVNKKD